MPLDLNRGYCHISLIKEEINVCAVILPWRNYHYKRLTMRVSNSPDIFQDKMEKNLWV